MIQALLEAQARPAARRTGPVDWRTTSVDGNPVGYCVAGQGPPAVFLHGWGLSPAPYGRALARLALNGVRVFAPSLPGFGGTAELAPRERNFAGFSRWLGQFLDVVGIDEPVTLIGHSFGGGVAIAAAHDLPERVGRLTLVNSIGGGAWSPAGGGESADPLAPTVDLTRELDAVAARGVPVTLVWGRHDTAIPRSSFDALRAALRRPVVFTVAGTHDWPIGDPYCFGYAMKTALESSRMLAA